MQTVIQVILEAEKREIQSVEVDKQQLVRNLVSVIKSLGLEKDVLRILRGY